MRVPLGVARAEFSIFLSFLRRQIFLLDGFVAIFVLLAYDANAASREVETVIVTGAQEKIDPLDFGASATVISEREIQINQYRTLGDVLRSAPGVFVASAGGQGAQTSVFIRGGESNHVLVLIDGVAINDPSASVPVSFASLSLLGVQRIEIVRGGLAAQFGSEALSGVIQIFTKKGSEIKKQRFSLEKGSNETNGWEFSRSEENYFFGVEYFLTAGESFTPEVLRNGVEGEDDGHSRFSSRLNFVSALGERWRVNGHVGYMDAESEFDGLLGEDYFQKELREQRWGSLVFKRVFSPANLDISLSFSYFGSNREYPFSSFNSSYQADVYNLQFAGVYAPQKGLRIQFGAEDEIAEVNVENYIDSRLNSHAFYGQVLYEPSPGWFATFALRNDNFDKTGGNYSYRASMTRRIPAHNFVIFGNYASGFRAPDSNELFGIGGNTDLKPEQSRSWEIGIEKEFPAHGFSSGLSYFQNRLSNLIEWQGDFITGQLNNVSQARIVGAELFFQYSGAGPWTLRFDQSLTSAKRNDGSRLLRRPIRSSSLKFYRRLGDASGLQLVIDYTGARRDLGRVDAIAARRGGYMLTRLALTRDFNDSLKGFTRIDNLFNCDYEPVSGYKGPGFYARVGFSLSF